MATGGFDSSEEDCVPLISSDDEQQSNELPALNVEETAEKKAEEVVVDKDHKESEDDQVNAVAVVDHAPKGDDEIELQRGEGS